jgi:Lar family restriction alleviation protein
MTDEVPLRKCPHCGDTDSLAVMIDTDIYGGTRYGVECSECGANGGFYDTRAEAVAAWNTRVSDPALAVKDARIVELEAGLEDVRDRIDAVKKSLLQRDKALDVQRERIAELERELFALKRPVGQGHDVDAFYRPETCERCKWGGYRERTGFVWCARPTGPGEWTDTDGKPGCDKWEAKEAS